MNPITIGDTDEEVIDLDSSQDTINVTDNEQGECSMDRNFLANLSNTDETNVNSDNVDNNKDAFETKSCDDSNTSQILFKVMFRDESVSRRYIERIKDFLKELVSSKVISQESDNGLTLEVWDNDNANDNDNDNKDDSTSRSIEIETTESDDSEDIICDTLFTVDTQPKLIDDLDVPTYGKKYEDAFDKTKSASSANTKEKCPPRLSCFNCNGNHNLRDCKVRRDPAVIEANRKNFNVKASKTLRYHLDDNQKFDHLIPGQLSSTLRKALGLKNNELPKHIYRMRRLGYPPGWLEEARLQHSGLALFNSDGVAEEDSDAEPGAIIEDGDKDQFDIKKIFDFPGFNVPAPPGTRDVEEPYWGSTMLAIHSKERMLMTLSGKEADDGYKRKKLKLNNTSKDTPAPEPCEMEIESIEECTVENVPANGLFIPPLPIESPVKPPEPLLSEDSDYHSQEVQLSQSPEACASPPRTSSPSLNELEDMKQQLLVELQESNSGSEKTNSSVSKSDMPPPSNEVTPVSNRIRPNGANMSQGSVKSVDLGTPVLQSTSPYNKLPSSEKFSKDICDIINFENLPDSTGKYEQMTGVLQKVRNTMAKLQQE
ncbi:zinc finger CCHC domain-containing protein 8 homolog isoform X1 [Ceratina calcarata]|uniref:Zinc finger CCHC domain-containing protein 8 homolog isoform X1 n=1 Tax=Ceratina calcarata TaxID=156304 RepID=A0AAJ7S7N6_9HYME|nr:zinc finger CCHC domain-containing protein 8 homolog isoform X2 [Ceratina calcarata]XP_026672408.1 zinc finger CCHC domain-containing protein 8 homolog isoform X1 [Ceratina calcarata]